MNVAIGLIIASFAVAVFAIVNSVEIAIVGVNRTRIRHLAENGSSAARAVDSLQHHQERFFTAIVFVQNVAVVVAAELGALVGDQVAGTTGLIVATVISTFGIALFGELTPKV